MKSFVDDSMKMTEKLGLDKPNAKETLTLSGTLSASQALQM